MDFFASLQLPMTKAPVRESRSTIIAICNSRRFVKLSLKLLLRIIRIMTKDATN
jgi:hypothetical protein